MGDDGEGGEMSDREMKKYTYLPVVYLSVALVTMFWYLDAWDLFEGVVT